MVNIVYRDRPVVHDRFPLVVVLVLACAAQLMVVLDGLIVSVALPAVRAGLGLSVSGQQWIVAGYLVTFGGLLLLAARAADLVGHRPVFLAGVAVFTVASLTGGLAPTGGVLIVARLVQGAGAAMLAPSSLSLLTATHHGPDRTRALSVWSATSGSAGALGLVLGGLITDTLGWRWVLLVNVPVGVALWIAASRVLIRQPSTARGRVDVPGALSVTVAVAALTYGMSRGPTAGWTSASTVAALLIAVGFAALFVSIEHRRTAPLVPLRMLARRNTVVANAIVIALGAVMTSTLYFVSLYHQQVRGDSPVRTGVLLLPLSVVLTAGALAARPLLRRLGARPLIAAGGVVMAAGSAWLALLPVHGDYLLGVGLPLVTWAAGAGLITMPAVSLATADAGPNEAGLASGLVNTARQVGGAVGLAALGGVAGAVSPHAAGADAAVRTVHGYAAAFAVCAAVALVIAICAGAARRVHR